MDYYEHLQLVKDKVDYDAVLNLIYLMSMMNEQKLEKVTKGESMVQIILSLLDKIPALSIPVDLFTKYQQNTQYNNIVDVLNKHAKRLSMLTDIVIDKLYIKSPAYAKDILLTVQKAKDELNEEKRKVYALYLTACCNTENEGDNNRELYLDYVGRIDNIDFFILSKLSTTFNGRDAIGLCSEGYNHKYSSKISTNDARVHFDHLVSLGLIERTDKDEYENFMKKNDNIKHRQTVFKKLNMYQRTSLGNALYGFINKG